MANLREGLYVDVDPLGGLKESRKKEFKDLLGFYLGGILHESWKSDDEVAYEAASDEKKQKAWTKGEDGVLRKFKSVDGNVDGKSYKDTTFKFKAENPAYLEEERKVDIRALTFAELPLVWQKENADAGKVAVDLVYDKMMAGEKLDIEELAAEVHKAWLSRPNNLWAIEYNAPESAAYEKLSEELKEKDRAHIREAIELMEQVKAGKITLEGLRTDIGSAKARFDAKMEGLEEKTN